MKKKILHTYKSYLPEKGGVATVIMWIVKGLSKFHDSTILVTRSKTLKSQEKTAATRIIRMLSLGNLFSMPIAPFYIFKFWELAKKHDTVVYHFPMPLIDLAVNLFFPKKIKLIVFYHADITAKKQKLILPILAPIIRRTLNKADKIIVSNPEIINHSNFIKDYKEKCEIVPFGIKKCWAQLTHVQKTQAEKIKKKYGKFFISVGRLVPYKGFETLIKALEGTNLKVILIGKGKLEKYLKCLAKKLGVQKQIIFKGNVDENLLKIYLAASYAFVFPSVTESEAFGIAQIEAMAFKKPIINTNLKSGVPWVARDGLESITVLPYDVTVLRNAMIKLANGDHLAKTIGEMGYKRYLQLFTQTQFLAGIARIL